MAGQQTNKNTDKKITLNITTPRGVKFTEKADMIIMRCIDGDLGVLSGHEPVSTVLGDGILRIKNNGMEKRLAVFGGIAEIDKKSVNIFSTIAQPPEEIDLERAEADLREAQASIMENAEEKHVQGLHVLIHRSMVRIQVHMHPGEIEYFDEDNEDNENQENEES